MEAKTKTYLYIGISILFVGFVIYWFGKKASTIQQAPLPNELPGMKELTTPEAKTVRDVATRLYNEMNGFNFTRDTKPYADFNNLSDKLFIAVYNDFNNSYASKGSGTLKEWINDEYSAVINNFVLGFGLFSVGTFKTLKNSIFERFSKLNLS